MTDSSSELLSLPTVMEGDFSLTEPLPTTIDGSQKFLEEKMANWQIGSEPMDAGTNQVIDTLKTSKNPEAARLLTNTLLQCMQSVNNRHLSPAESVSRTPITNEFTTAVNGQLRHLYLSALQADADTTLRIIKDYFDPSQMETTFIHHKIVDLFSLPETLEQAFKQTGPETCRYFGTDYHLIDSSKDQHADLQLVPGGIVIARNRDSQQIENWYSLNPLIKSTDSDNALSCHPGIDQLMMMGFAEHERPNDGDLKHFFSDVPELVNQLAPFFRPDSSPLQNHIAGFFHIWEALGQKPDLTDSMRTFFEAYQEDAFHFFTAGIFSDREVTEVCGWLTKVDDIAMSSPAGESTTMGKYLLNQIEDITKHAPHYAEQTTTSDMSRHALLETFFEQTRSVILTGIELTKAALADESIELDQAVFNFTINALSQQIRLFHELNNFHLSAPLTQAQPLSESLHTLMQHQTDWSVPDNQNMLRTMVSTWFAESMFHQRHASYFANIDQITAVFYDKYQSITHLKDRTTVNDDIELPKHLAIFEADASTGRLTARPAENPYQVAMLGCVGMRIERHLQEPLRQRVVNSQFHGYDPFPPENNTETESLLDSFQAIALQNLRYHPELKDSADRTFTLGSPLMDVVRFYEQVEAIASLAHITKLNGVLETDNAFPKGKNSYEAEIKMAVDSLEVGQVEGIFSRTWQLPNGEIIGKPFDAKDPLKFILLMREAGFSPVNFPSEPQAVKTICDIASLDDSFIAMENIDNYLAKLQVESSEKFNQIMTDSHTSPQQIREWLNLAKKALYQIPNPDRTYNRWLLEFQKVSEPSALFNALLESVQKHFVLPSKVEQPTIN